MMDVSADDFGEGDRNINQILNSTEQESEEHNEDIGNEEDLQEGFLDEEEEEEPVIGSGQNQNLFFLVLQMFLALGAVLFVIYALLKFINKRAQNFNSHNTIQNMGGTGVGPNRSVQIVRVGKRVLVVGVGDTVELLKEIEDPQEIELMMQTHQSSQEIFEQPISRLTGWLEKRKKSPKGNANEAAFRSLLDHEMKDVKKSQTKVHSVLEEKD